MLLIKSGDPNEQALRVLALNRIVFGETPITKRIGDIKEEADELVNYTSEENLREETGDLLNSLLSLCAEKGWIVNDLVKESMDKIQKRHNSGHYADGKNH